MSNLLEAVVGNPKVATTVAGVSTSVGVGSLIGMIPNEIGKLTALAGFFLSIVLIYTHLVRSRLHKRETELKIDLLLAEKQLREETSKLRKKEGLPTDRRREDHLEDEENDR